MPSDRGAHPEDPKLFRSSELPALRAAVHDLSWLWSRDYGDAAKKLVGDRYRLTRRQRDAVARSACSDTERAQRLKNRLHPEDIVGGWLDIDAFNVLITIETALGGGYIFAGRDTAFRDVNPVQGTYRVVNQTAPAIELMAEAVCRLDLKGIRWHLDQSVSNVGRVKSRLADGAPNTSVEWTILVGEDVDGVLRDSKKPVVTSDSWVLDGAKEWFHLEAWLHDWHLSDVNLVDLRPDGERTRPLSIAPEI